MQLVIHLNGDKVFGIIARTRDRCKALRLNFFFCHGRDADYTLVVNPDGSLSSSKAG